MIHRIAIALLMLGLTVPGASARVWGDPEPQLNTYPEGLFYAAGRSYLGVGIQDVTSDRVSALKLKEERGVEVTMVDQDAPAAKAGLKEHDVILEYNGARVESDEQIRRLIRETPPGRTAVLGISRDGSPMTIKVQLGDRAKLAADTAHKQIHERFEPFVTHIPEITDFNFDIQPFAPALGIQVDPLGRQLGEFFGVKGGEGLLVKSVEKGSVAEKAGLKAGDVITQADNQKIADRTELRRVLNAHRSGGKVTLGIVRDKHEQNVTVDLPARKSGGSSWFAMPGSDRQSFDDIQIRLRDLQPMLRQRLQELRPQLLKAQASLSRITPEMESAMSQARTKLEEARKQIEKQQKEWKTQFHRIQMI